MLQLQHVEGVQSVHLPEGCRQQRLPWGAETIRTLTTRGPPRGNRGGPRCVWTLSDAALVVLDDQAKELRLHSLLELKAAKVVDGDREQEAKAEQASPGIRGRGE